MFDKKEYDKEYTKSHWKEYREKNKEKYDEVHICPICNGHYKLLSKSVHFKSKKHIVCENLISKLEQQKNN